MKVIASDPLPSGDSSGRSFRGALDTWQPDLTSHPRGRKSLPTSAWRLVWLLLDSILWVAAAGLSLGLLFLFSRSSEFPNASVILIPYGMTLLAAWLVGAYDRDTDFASLRFASEILIVGLLSAVISAGLVALFGSYGRGVQASRFFLFATPLFATVGTLLLRRLWWAHVDHGYADLRIIVVGEKTEAARLEHALRLTDRPLHVVSLDPAQATDGGLESLLRAPLLNPDNPDSVAALFGRDTIVIAPSAVQAVQTLSPFLVGLHASTVPVYTWSAFWSQRVKTLDWGSNTADWFFEKDFRLAQRSLFSHLKRLSDFLIGCVALLLASPIILITALMIRIDSRGPAIFTQKRVGLRGKEFTIYKFRTMTLHAERSGTTTTKGDARITRLGNFLRKFRLDEIPQLINVIKGDMSLVGPRPEWTVCVQNYEHQLPCYHLRHLVKPGITGWAQVNYPYGEGVEDARNKLSFDLYYVAHSSFILDCSIVLKTLYVLLGRIGGR
jgi:exopolysaccharide biosynthesis polyprenyl glycosylphosphotransferase